MSDEINIEEKAKVGPGLIVSWKTAAFALLVVLGGGGGYTSFQFVTQQQLDEKTKELEQKASQERSDLQQSVQGNADAIIVVTAKIEQVQEVQYMDIAFRESNRVIDETIKCRAKDSTCLRNRDVERERVRRLNVRRLANGEPPCSDLKCN